MKNKDTAKTRKKIILPSIMSIFTLLACGTATFAWFTIVRPKMDIGTISGNLDYISIDKVSAYRYVYPFYEGSNTFIDYDKDAQGNDKGKLKGFVLEDNSLSEPKAPSEATYSSSAPYCLIGDEVFNGRSGKDYSTDAGWPLYMDSASSSSGGTVYSAKDVVLSKGASFAVMKKPDGGSLVQRNEGTYTDCKDCFKATGNSIQCLVAGLYDIFVTEASDGTPSLEIRKSTSRKDKDSAIVGRTLFDPTYAKINNVDGAEAIYTQKTLVVFDISLTIKKQDNPIDFSLDVNRFDIAGKDIPRVDPEDKSVEKESSYLYASDFRDYRYKDVTERGNRTGSDAIWNAFHSENDYFTKNGDRITVNEEGRHAFSKDQSSLSLRESTQVTDYFKDTQRRILVAVDFNPERVDYFFAVNRLGREYSLLRDYTFYFSCTQHKEAKQ